MIILPSDLTKETLNGILRENILRGADGFDGDVEMEIERARSRVFSGELVIVYSNAKNDVTLVHKDTFKK